MVNEIGGFAMKRCQRCKEEKDESCFCKNKRGNDGLEPICRACNKERAAKYREENKEKLSAHQREYLERNKDLLKERRDLKNLQARDMKENVCVCCC